MCNTGSVALEFTDCFHSITDKEELRRVSYSISYWFHSLNKSTLFLDCLCFMPSNTIRTIRCYYWCYHMIHSFIRGCEIVFVSINRLIVLLCIEWPSKSSFNSWKDTLKQLKGSETTPGKRDRSQSSKRLWFLCHTYPHHLRLSWFFFSFEVNKNLCRYSVSSCLVHGTYVCSWV